jgi:hypothetical protein
MPYGSKNLFFLPKKSRMLSGLFFLSFFLSFLLRIRIRTNGHAAGRPLFIHSSEEITARASLHIAPASRDTSLSKRPAMAG